MGVGVGVGPAVGVGPGVGVGATVDGFGIWASNVSPAMLPERILNSDVATSLIELPRMPEMIGVAGRNGHVKVTLTVSPTSYAVSGVWPAIDVSAAASVKTGAGGASQPSVPQSLLIAATYCACSPGSPAAFPTLRVERREVRADARRVLQDDPAVERATEVDREQQDDQKDGQDQRELDQALAPASGSTRSPRPHAPA